MAKRNRPTMYDAGNGRKVTVPGSDEQAEGPCGAGSPCQKAFDAVREQLSPHAIAAIASCLQINRTNDPQVDQQVRWFHDQLCELVGGYEQQSRLAEELGL